LTNARCGYLVVPEDRSQPSGRTIQLFVAIIPAQSGKSAPDPIVYLGTGPGGIAIVEAALLIDTGVYLNRDLVVMAQRGQFLSIPALTCAAIDDFNRQLLSLRFYSEATKRKHLRATADCHRELLATGANLPSYNSSENAADFADLRTVLGITEWNVLGVSYGTDLAQMYVRDHPEGIRSVVLDSVIPVTITIAKYWHSTRAGFDNLFQACAAEAACSAAHPNLETTVTDLVKMLEAEPLTTTVNDPATGEELKVVIDGGAFVDWIRDQSRTNTKLTRVPAVIDELAHGNPRRWRPLPCTGYSWHHRRLRAFPPRATDWGTALFAASNSPHVTTSSKPVGRLFRFILPRSGIRRSAPGRTRTMTAGEFGKSLLPRRECADHS